MNSALYPLFLTLGLSLPLLLVCAVGTVTAIVTWRRHPSVSLATLVAMGLLFLGVALRVAYGPIVSVLVGRGGGEHFQWVFIALNAFSSLMHCAALAVLLWAVFTHRGTSIHK